MPTNRPRRVALFGAPLDSGNRGVEALGRATVVGVLTAGPDSVVTVFDNGWGVRSLADRHLDGAAVELCGVRLSRRVHRPESWARIAMSQRLGLANPVADRLRRADLVLDLSGGDSFSDMYGRRRLEAVLAPKLAALRAGRPLVLLPQTYGPYRSERSRSAATAVLRKAQMVWSRDEDSHTVLMEMLGAEADPARHRSGVDMAFGLEPVDPADALSAPQRAFLESRDGPLVGVNVSGLLYAARAAARFGLAMDYRAVMSALLDRLVHQGARVVLVPHVRDRAGAGESDVGAAESVLASLPHLAAERVTIVPDTLDAHGAKWVISRCDWFSGARMHATIAALSTGVPVAGVAYSMKFRGVFATCGLEGAVIDGRKTPTEEALAMLIQSFEDRGTTRERLEETRHTVVKLARQQLTDALEAADAQVRL